jgi:FkbM family methyltransferase
MVKLQEFARATLPRSVRNWLRAPAKSLSWSWNETRFRLGARQTVEIRPGFKLVCHPLAYAHSYFAQIEDPAQATEFDAFIEQCREGMVLFDLGAHFGLFALAALRYGGPRAVAVAVDASPVAVRMIDVQARLNALESRLTTLQACICDEDGRKEMVAIGPLADGYFTPPALGTPKSETTSTPAITLDRLVAQTGKTPTHVKIDVEGFEESALRGGRRLLEGPAAPKLFIELHCEMIRSAGRDPDNVFKLLDELGYTARDFVGVAVDRRFCLAQPLVRFQAGKGSR